MSSCYIYVGCFALVGAIIGFWTIRDKPDLPRRRWEMFKSIAAGVFTALITYTVALEELGKSHHVSMMIAGGFAFGGTDAILFLYQLGKDFVKKRAGV